MKRLVPTLVLALAANTLPLTASAQTPPPPTHVPAQDAKQGPRQLRPRVPPPVRPSGFDARGWTLLGEQTVDGRRDRDVINVGRSARYTDLTLVVEDSDLELLDLTIHFDNGTTFVPSVRQFFRDGTRTRAVSMPKDGRAVTRIELRYGNVVAGGRARVQAWGKEEAQAPTRPSGFDARGWTLLGEKHVDGRRDRDSFKINRQDAAVTKLAFVVEDASAYLTGVTVYFGNGQKYSPMLTQIVGDAARVRVIDLPGEIRRVTRVEFAYGQEGSGRPRVQVWGKQEEAPPAKPSNFDPRGWTFLAEKTVDGWQDKDTINVKPQYGNFTKLALVVEDSDLELLDLTVSYGRGQRYTLDVRQVFRDGSRAKIVDLPGTAAAVKRIELKYRNLPGDARAARVQVWAREDVTQTPTPTPTPGQPEFDPRGLTALGGVNVDPNARTQYMEGLVGRNKFSRITVYAVKGDLDLEGITLTYPSFKKANVPVKHRFADGARVLTFDVPASNELIQSLTFKYGRNRGPGVSLQVFGTVVGGTLPAPGPAPSPSVPVQVQGSLDTRGWTAVGAVNADPSRGVDTFVGGIARTRLNKVALLVERGELALDGFTLVFGDNSTMAPSFRHTFKDGARVIIIEVPANKGAIKQLELRYADRNAARVGIQVFGLK